MGREIRRVALDFDWKLDETWAGFLNPYCGHCPDCEACEGSGYNPETRRLSDDWYDQDNFGVTWGYEYVDGRAAKIVGTTRRWCDKLTQDEVDALVAELRFTGLTHTWDEGKREWVPKNPMPRVTAEEVNAANVPGARGMGHDAINRSICVEARAKRLGVYGLCPRCNGSGSVWESKAWEYLHDAWEGIDPPAGEGWQVWETVSDGSPVTPVFATPELLVDYLVETGCWGRKYSRAAAEAFVRDGGWVPSMVLAGTQLLVNIEAAPLMKKQ